MTGHIMEYLDQGGNVSEDTGKREAFCSVLYVRFLRRDFVCEFICERLYHQYGDSQ